MVKLTGLGLVGVGLVVIMAQPCWADVIPSRRASQNGDARNVTTGLEKTGLNEVQAQQQARHMSPGDMAYFATDPARVQLVGGLIFEEIVGGALLLGIILGVYAYRVGFGSD